MEGWRLRQGGSRGWASGLLACPWIRTETHAQPGDLPAVTTPHCPDAPELWEPGSARFCQATWRHPHSRGLTVGPSH